ncbi:MAG: PIN domain-containing protein [Desulfobacterales bacterium]|nr:PIN domain-containing protein [Desulfobacterales bacterium]
MKVIIDTCIWSLALRRKENQTNGHVKELKELIKEVRSQLIGPVRHEILSGVKSKKQFDTLKNHLSAFIDLPLSNGDYELAAEYYNTAREDGSQGSNTDFLLCAVSVRHGMPIFTIDRDFIHFQRVMPIKLHPIRVAFQ